MKLAWMGLLLGGCIHSSPYMMSASDRPIDGELELASTVTSTRCRTFIFGRIPLSPPYTSRNMLQAARGRHDVLVQISWDKRVTNYLFATEECDILYATPADFVEAPGRSAAATSSTVPASGRSAPTASASPSVAAPAVVVSPPPSEGPAWMLADGEGADRISGFDGHTWRDSKWHALLAHEETEYGGRLYQPSPDRVAISGQTVSHLRYGFRRDQMVEVQFQTNDGVALVTELLGAPDRTSPTARWSGDAVRADVDGSQVRVTFEAYIPR